MKPGIAYRKSEQRFPAAFRRLCVETWMPHLAAVPSVPAAFRRLCVETRLSKRPSENALRQPPSGGCVLKPMDKSKNNRKNNPAAFRRLCVETSGRRSGTRLIPGQPPSGGCVLKRPTSLAPSNRVCQPPSGGCVLKREMQNQQPRNAIPAAFRRLCVETDGLRRGGGKTDPAAFRRLCVET